MRIMNLLDKATITVATTLFFAGARNVNEALGQLAAMRNAAPTTRLTDLKICGFAVSKEHEHKSVRDLLSEFDHAVNALVHKTKHFLNEAH